MVESGSDYAVVRILITYSKCLTTCTASQASLVDVNRGVWTITLLTKSTVKTWKTHADCRHCDMHQASHIPVLRDMGIL